MSIFNKYNTLKIIILSLKKQPRKIYKFFKTFKYPVRSILLHISLFFYLFYFNNVKKSITPVWVLNLNNDVYLPENFFSTILVT